MSCHSDRTVSGSEREKRKSFQRRDMGALRPLVDLRFGRVGRCDGACIPNAARGFLVKAIVTLVILGILSMIALGACGLSSCETAKHGVKDLSEENVFLTGGSPIVDVLDIEEVAKTDERISCRGRAKLEDGRSVWIRFAAYNEDGTEYISFRTEGAY